VSNVLGESAEGIGILNAPNPALDRLFSANWRYLMARNVADLLWEMLERAGVKRCYGIVGDALNPVIDALRRDGKIEFIHVRHEEYGVFAAVADSCLTAKGYTLSLARQVLNGRLDTVIKTIEHNVRLV
jgi:hypothetical protein